MNSPTLSGWDTLHARSAALREYAALLRERDELKAALNRLLECPDLCLDSLEEETYAACDQACAAIGHAQGGAA